jgi:hypothetical protein
MSFRAILFVILAALLCTHAAAAKTRIAIITPEVSPLTTRYARNLENSLESGFRVLDAGLAASAYASLKIESPFNQTLSSAKSIGTVVGCDNFILLRGDTSRRSSSARPAYYEASAFIFLVNARTGRLAKFILAAKQADTPESAENSLLSDTDTVAAQVASIVGANAPVTAVDFDRFDPDTKNMRPAMPYRRIKPVYTSTAFLFDIRATVEAEASIDADGNVKRIDIVRWAGFGLDESVIEAINNMNWRAGERGGKPLPMRVLLRYNFTKIEKEPQ